MPKDTSLLSLLFLEPKSRRRRQPSKPVPVQPAQPATPTPTSPTSPSDDRPVPLAIWLQAGGTGPPPLWSEFLSLARRKVERARLDREAVAAWEEEKEAAYKAVEDVWGKRGGGVGGGKKKIKGKELRGWFNKRAGPKAKSGNGGGKDVVEKTAEEERVAPEQSVMSGANGGGDNGEVAGEVGNGDGAGGENGGGSNAGSAGNGGNEGQGEQGNGDGGAA